MLDGILTEDLRWKIIIGATCFLALVWIVSRIRRFFRRRRPPVIHPKLQKYQPTAESIQAIKAEAEKIIATTSGPDIAGFRIVRQIEAVFVDGFRQPGEAVEGLKAAAAIKGANGIVNVKHIQGEANKYSACGDAVVVEEIGGNSTFSVDA